jgi:hypothetical protein
MARILTVLNAQGLKCLRSGYARIEYERFDEYQEPNEPSSENAFETDPPVGDLRSLTPPDDCDSIFRFFLDGSRKTYKVADVIAGNRYLPVIAGQVGVAVLERDINAKVIQPRKEFCRFENVMAFPDKVSGDDVAEYQITLDRLLQRKFVLLRYENQPDADPVDKAVAKIMQYMHDKEIETVYQMADSNLLGNERILVRDGPLQFRKPIDLSKFRNVIGLSKTFRPHVALGTGRARKDVGSLTVGLRFGQRTVTYKMEVFDKVVGFWYLRLRHREQTANPIDGVVKIERLALTAKEREDGLETSIVNTLSQHILRERNVTPFKADSRWSTHIYPIYLTEKYLKLSFMSDLCFTALF